MGTELQQDPHDRGGEVPERATERAVARNRTLTGAVYTRTKRWVMTRDEIVRVSIVALIGTLSGWLTYELVYWMNPISPRATTSWGLAFIIGIFRQHHLHRRISFPRNALSYVDSLKRDFAASAGIWLLSIGFNFLMTEILAIHHRSAWLLTAVFVAGVEYLLLKLFVFPKRKQRGNRW